MITSFELEKLKYPIGNFNKKENYTPKEIKGLIETIENSPFEFRQIIEILVEGDHTKTYREGSWNIQQLIHHVADIQLLHFFRMKKALTEPDYKEVTLVNLDGWATTPDATKAPIEDSLYMLEGVTKRYVYLMKSLDDAALQIAYFHPVRKFMINQAQAIAMSAWHLNHHYAHIKLALGLRL